MIKLSCIFVHTFLLVLILLFLRTCKRYMNIALVSHFLPQLVCYSFLSQVSISNFCCCCSLLGVWRVFFIHWWGGFLGFPFVSLHFFLFFLFTAMIFPGIKTNIPVRMGVCSFSSPFSNLGDILKSLVKFRHDFVKEKNKPESILDLFL